MKAKKKNKIVFVCTGNTCRSPMAAALFQREIAPLNLSELIVCSAGIQADEKGFLNEKSAQVLQENGIQMQDFHPTKVCEDLLKESLAIVCMTEVHKEYMMDLRWNVLRASGAKRIDNNVYSFKEIVGYDIPDPYGKNLETYRYVFELMEVGMPAIKEKILTEKVVEKLVRKPRKTTKKTGEGAEEKPKRKTRKKSANA